MNITKKQNFIISICIISLIILFILNPSKNIESSLNGIILWATAVLPALFPFLVFTKFLTELNVVEYMCKVLNPITNKLFKVPGVASYIYLLSILSGYPIGAKLTSDFYEKGVLTKGQAIRITTFTSTSGPLFILGTVAIGLFNDKKLGLIILISHFLGAIINGLIYRNYLYNENEKIVNNFKVHKNMLEDIMYSSIQSILIIGGYISIFFVIISILNNYNILYPFNKLLGSVFDLFNIPSELSKPITNGLIEVTRGCLDLSKVKNLSYSLTAAITTFLISFGGLSIHFQALTFLKKFDIKLTFYFLQKLTHATISTIIAILLTNII